MSMSTCSMQIPITIAQALDNVESNRYLLPSIQREFVWDHKQIEWLFDSIMRGYAFGTFLFWSVKADTKEKFVFYQFIKEYRQYFKTHNEEIQTNGLSDFYAVLDGQQRLTALYIGAKGSYAYKRPRVHKVDNEDNIPTRHLYLNVLSPLEDTDDGRYYEFSFLTKKQFDSDQGANKWFRVGKILDLRGFAQFTKFMNENGYSQNEYASETISKLHEVFHSEKTINYFLEEDQSIDKALDIFIRINSKGEPLSFSDLLMSILIANWREARNEINDLVDEIRDIGFTINKDFVLKSFLVMHSTDIRFKINNFSTQNAKELEVNWDKIRKSIITVFKLMKSFGFHEQTLTSKNAIIPIVYYIYSRDLYDDYVNKIHHQSERALIKKWTHIVLLNQVFGSSADTVLTNVRNTIKSKLSEGATVFPAKDVIDKLRSSIDVSYSDDFIDGLLEVEYHSPVAFSILSLLYPQLDYRNNDFHKDHLHPISQVYSQNKVSYTTYNSIVNLQMLDSRLNMSKQDLSLKEWVEKENIDLKKQLIPDEIEFDQIDVFFEKRREILRYELKKALQL
ncbi:DUF262 domain-containing protein [Brevibacillus nitrificans]|uniref:DUF262 domain-containing protein n=1 Tax=Brevibacillus nitrificans TaxID=651560 RepID=UPI0028544B77|nr:DUF262 domain-containing protein [Brevibacillus nitrificans]MDR7316063.1 uncharacterized protein with ParB-like and HNH nuclease domain [Brevibacillus nitrificans]